MDPGAGNDDTLDATLARLGTAHAGVSLVAAVMAATGLTLRDAVDVVAKSRSRRSLGHVTAAKLDVIKRARAASNERDAAPWINLFVDAVLDAEPWLTGVPGPAAGLYYWRREQPPTSAEWWVKQIAEPNTAEQREALRLRLAREPHLVDESPGWFGGDASFDGLRAGLRKLVAGSAFWSDHIQIVRDEPPAVTCRFTLD